MSPEEQSQLLSLVGRVDLKTSPVEDLITLGLLYIEPVHQEERGIQLFEAALKREPGCALAAVWLAYNVQHYMMDRNSLSRALAVLAPFCKVGAKERGAALLLSALIRRDLGAAVEHVISGLEDSVRAEPAWVSNRELLSGLYRKQGRYGEALGQAQAAKENLIPPDKSWDVMRENYELLITWRAAYRHSEDLERLIQGISQEGGL